MKGIFITGTDTDVGKTWVSRQLIKQLSNLGIDVVPRKPVESGWPSDETLSDAWRLTDAANKTDTLNEVCPNRFQAAISPDRAALLEKRELTVGELKKHCLNNFEDKQFLLVEGAGGFYSPICSDGLNADLAESLNLPIILVVENRLGCINQTLLTIEAIEKRGMKLIAVILNQVSPSSHIKGMDNKSDLESLCDYPIISIANSNESNKPFEELASLVR